MERIKRLIKPIVFLFFSVYIISCEKTKTPPATNPTKSVTYPFMSSLVVYNGNLIVGGQFTNIGGAPFNNIAQWNGTSWSALGSGLNGSVDALGVYNGKLIASGGFTMPGSSSLHQFARWNGSVWDTIPGALSGYGGATINTMAVYHGKLYVGGDFYSINTKHSLAIASWNDTVWSSVDNGLSVNVGASGVVSSLMVYNGALYVGGGFQWANGFISVNNIAKWNDTVWSSLGSGMNAPGPDNSVGAFTVWNGNLYAGGYYTTAGGISANSIAQWNDTTWSALGSTATSDILTLTTFNNNLVAGGLFSTFWGVNEWNGSNWSALGSSYNNASFALINYNNNLYSIFIKTIPPQNRDSSYIAEWIGNKWLSL